MHSHPNLHQESLALLILVPPTGCGGPKTADFRARVHVWCLGERIRRCWALSDLHPVKACLCENALLCCVPCVRVQQQMVPCSFECQKETEQYVRSMGLYGSCLMELMSSLKEQDSMPTIHIPHYSVSIICRVEELNP